MQQTNHKPHHWADQTAQRLIYLKPKQKQYTLAAGITPSGTVHIGNFRELITVDFVNRSLKKMGKQTRFYFSWDDYDVFRKVPQNMPKQEVLSKYLGKSIIATPDPYEKEKSYAEYHEKQLEEAIRKVGIHPEFIYQSQKYRQQSYSESIKIAMQKKNDIITILNKYRTHPLGENWYPISVFCEKCGDNEICFNDYNGEYQIQYTCQKCHYSTAIDFRKTQAVKLLWRIDWPMRWAYEKVDFEPGGKDHSSDGGSFTTAKEIAQAIYQYTPPAYLMYDFVRIKGKGGKISSSSGEVITLDDVLQIYEPEMVRYLFASYRNNIEFAISFDLDVLKIYEDFDRLEKKCFGLEEVAEKKLAPLRRIYELSLLEEQEVDFADPLAKPYRAAFRHLTNLLQIYNFDIEKTIAYYQQTENIVFQERDLKKLKQRIKCASYWIKNYSPQDFRFQLNDITIVENKIKKKLTEETLLTFQKVRVLLENHTDLNDISAKELSDKLYEIVHEMKLEPTDFFKSMYLVLIHKEKGPKLANFMKIIGKEKILELLPSNDLNDPNK